MSHIFISCCSVRECDRPPEVWNGFFKLLCCCHDPMYEKVQVGDQIVLVVLEDQRTELPDFPFLFHESSEILVHWFLSKALLTFKVVDKDFIHYLVNGLLLF